MSQSLRPPTLTLTHWIQTESGSMHNRLRANSFTTSSRNAEGFAAQIVTTIDAKNFLEAERIAYRNLAPFLSHWATYFDVPVVAARIEMEELRFGTRNMSVTNPFE